ncbi:Thioredoxin O2, putative isoform 1 [Hibiscus syriacus]|uniref:Thioredoxin O2, putative isoform 1 n=1 Tax=Hibiscus syriacus TaxID=106335 RepID=A0A6A2Z919_HIBSY|nr:Thioredoxin O2, putative isoform 1 [Hibiscus syriacus]
METISVATPINLKKSSKTGIPEQPVLYLNIQPFDKEAEIASLTDDDDLSTHSSHNQHDKIGSEPVNGRIARPGLAFPSDGTSANSGVSTLGEVFKQLNGNTSLSSSKHFSSNPENPVTHHTGKVSSSKARVAIPVDVNSDNVKDEDSQRKTKDARKARRHDQSHVDRYLSTNSRVRHWEGNAEKSSWEDELDSQILGPEEYSLQERLGFRPPQDSQRKQVALRSNTFASSRATTELKGGFLSNDRQKCATPVQLHVSKAKSNGPSKIQFMENSKENPIPDKTSNGTTGILGEREESTNSFSNSKVDSGNSHGLLKKTQVKKAKENDISEKIHNSSTSDTCNESNENAKSFSNNKVELYSKIEMLEEELREAAVLEASLYSVVAEHGSSTNKVHAPARRLCRFYLHACRANTQDKRPSAARAAISGLVLISKACGNDVPMLTFWLSNTIVLRATVSHAIKEMKLCSKCSDDWVDLQTFLLALQKFEAWIFSRIIESVWWQVNPSFCCCKELKLEENLGLKTWIRLDVAMFNAILRESADEMPMDPISDPISVSKVLPIPAGKSSFGAGVQLKNAIGNWSRWPTDLFGIDENESPEGSKEVGDCKNAVCDGSFKSFCLLNALSDLTMLPSEMLVDRSTRKEVCPKFSAPLIIRVLNKFVPVEFNPNSVSQAVFEALEEDLSEAGEDSVSNFQCMATPIVYSPPSTNSLKDVTGGQTMERSRSLVLRKSYTSDDELDELDSPITSIMIEIREPPRFSHFKRIHLGDYGKGRPESC